MHLRRVCRAAVVASWPLFQETLFAGDSKAAGTCHCPADSKKDAKAAVEGIWPGKHVSGAKGYIRGGSQTGGHRGLMCSFLGLHGLGLSILLVVCWAGAAPWCEPAPTKVEDPPGLATNFSVAWHLLQLPGPCENGLPGTWCVHSGALLWHVRTCGTVALLCQGLLAYCPAQSQEHGQKVWRLHAQGAHVDPKVCLCVKGSEVFLLRSVCSGSCWRES